MQRGCRFHVSQLLQSATDAVSRLDNFAAGFIVFERWKRSAKYLTKISNRRRQMLMHRYPETFLRGAENDGLALDVGELLRERGRIGQEGFCCCSSERPAGRTPLAG